MGATDDGAAGTGRPRRGRDRRHVRHEAARREILEAAWETVRTEGLAALSVRGLARSVGIEPQSLYTYFPSKHAVYDAMFAQGNRELLSRLEDLEPRDDLRAALRSLARLMIEFDVDDPARSQLLFDRVVPGFEPSAESYALAERAYELCRSHLAAAGLHDDEDVDLFTALVGGLVVQQRANDPGGDRWLRLLDEAVEMFSTHVLERRGPRRRAPGESRPGGPGTAIAAPLSR